MTARVTRRGLAAGAAGLLALPAIASRAAEPIRLRCSLDTAPSHGRNVSIADYLKKVEQASGGRIKPELFQSGQLFPDLKVGKALIAGAGRDGLRPAAGRITGIVPNCDLFQLPALYGQTIDVMHKVIDGKRRRHRRRRDRSSKLRAHVLGPWLDLGYPELVQRTKKPITSRRPARA